MKYTDKRVYRMSARAEAAEQTARDILRAAVGLWRDGSNEEMTLEAIADRAGVSVRTVIRRFGSKEGLITAVIETDAAGIRAMRGDWSPGDIAGALRALLNHYERDGDAVLRSLTLENSFAIARETAEAGRQEHRMWCSEVFSACLPPPESEPYAPLLDAFVAATDIYVWKLFRRDLGHSAAETEKRMRLLVDGLINHHTCGTCS